MSAVIACVDLKTKGEKLPADGLTEKELSVRIKECGKDLYFGKNPHVLNGVGPQRNEIVRGDIANNYLLSAVHLAFAKHVVLRLSPDIIWFALSQVFNEVILQNPEKHRNVFVSHEGKKELEVVQTDAYQNTVQAWQSMLDKFRSTLTDNVTNEEARDALFSEFSTTTQLERTVNTVAAMSAMQKYFSFSCHTMCGVAGVELTGTHDDWKKVRDNAVKLAALLELDPAWMKEDILPVLAHFIELSETGKASDPDFWERIYYYNAERGSGRNGQRATGWITAFFPLQKKGENVMFQREPLVQRALKMQKDDCGTSFDEKVGLDLHAIPSSVLFTPFLLKYMDGSGYTKKLQVCAGLISVCVCEEGRVVYPAFAWYIMDPSEKQAEVKTKKAKLEKAMPGTVGPLSWDIGFDLETNLVSEMQLLQDMKHEQQKK